MKVLILGGYGVFGGRLARLLKDEAGLTIVLAGRSLAKAEAACGRLHPEASATLDPANETAVNTAASTAQVINATCGECQRGWTRPSAHARVWCPTRQVCGPRVSALG